MEHWYALYTKSHKERHVSSVLESRGFETYLPIIQVMKDGQRRAEPFFSCYLFVRLDPATALPSVRWTPDLRRIVGFGGQPAVVPNQVISLIQQRLAKMGELDYQGCRFKAGDRVVIKDGRFKDFEAVFDRALSNRDRAMVLVDLLGQWMRCEVDVGCLEKLW
jgi:transcription elongation factor/antiterminator RfaH